jgi:hypothetical protein
MRVPADEGQSYGCGFEAQADVQRRLVPAEVLLRKRGRFFAKTTVSDWLLLTAGQANG